MEWSYGGAYGHANVNSAGAKPGGLVNVDYTPGIGITNREEDLLFVIGLPVASGIAFGLVYLRRSRRGAW